MGDVTENLPALQQFPTTPSDALGRHHTTTMSMPPAYIAVLLAFPTMSLIICISIFIAKMLGCCGGGALHMHGYDGTLTARGAECCMLSSACSALVALYVLQAGASTKHCSMRFACAGM